MLIGYASVLDTIDEAPPVMWTRSQNQAAPGWMRFPAPRALVRTLLVRHISRCISALKRRGARRAALADDAPGPLRDLSMLEQFEQSMPTSLRMAVIAPLMLAGLLLVAYIISNALPTPYTKLLADLTRAALTVDRAAAIQAFEKDRVGAQLYAGMAIVIAWSTTLLTVQLLPAFSVKRRLLRPLAELEARGFATLGCGRVQELELDLLARILLFTPVAVVGLAWLGCSVWAMWTPPSERVWDFDGGVKNNIGGALTGALIVSSAVLGGIELRRRYAARRTGITRRTPLIMRVALFVMWTFVCVGLF